MANLTILDLAYTLLETYDADVKFRNQLDLLRHRILLLTLALYDANDAQKEQCQAELRELNSSLAKLTKNHHPDQQNFRAQLILLIALIESDG